MKHLKLFEEMNIVDGKDFPLSGNRLSPRERKILTDLIDNEYLNFFTIRVEDHYYYCSNGWYYNKFDDFNELKYYLLSRYYIAYNKSIEYLDLLKTSKLNPSFDNNRIIKWAFVKRYKEIVKLLLNDERVRSKLSDLEINKYTNETS